MSDPLEELQAQAMKQSDNCPRCKHSMDHHVSFNTGRAIRCNYDADFQPCRCDEFVGKPKPRRPQGNQAMTEIETLREEPCT